MLTDVEVKEVVLWAHVDAAESIESGETTFLERYPTGVASILKRNFSYPAPSDQRPLYGLIYVRISEDDADIANVGAKLGKGIFGL